MNTTVPAPALQGYGHGHPIKINITVSETLKAYVLEKGYDRLFGARPLRRVIQQTIEDELAEGYIKGTVKEGDDLFLDWVDHKVTIEKR